jgi:hypothetical protein
VARASNGLKKSLRARLADHRYARSYRRVPEAEKESAWLDVYARSSDAWEQGG